MIPVVLAKAGTEWPADAKTCEKRQWENGNEKRNCVHGQDAH